MIASSSAHLQVLLQFAGDDSPFRVVANSLKIVRERLLRSKLKLLRPSNLTRKKVEINLPLNLTESETMFSAGS